MALRNAAAVMIGGTMDREIVNLSGREAISTIGHVWLFNGCAPGNITASEFRKYVKPRVYAECEEALVANELEVYEQVGYVAIPLPCGEVRWEQLYVSFEHANLRTGICD